jgi:hypothetical protein
VLPHASLAVHVLVTIRWKPVEQLAELSVVPVKATVGTPHASDAVGVTISGSVVTIQFRSTLAGVLVNTGGVTSAVHVTVRDVDAVLPQASVAVNVLV